MTTTPGPRYIGGRIEYDLLSQTLIFTERLGPDEWGAAQVVGRDVPSYIGQRIEEAEARADVDGLRDAIATLGWPHPTSGDRYVDGFNDARWNIYELVKVYEARAAAESERVREAQAGGLQARSDSSAAAGDKAEAPRDSTGHRSVDGYCIEPGCTVHAAAPRAATEPDLTDALRERFATLEALAEAVAAYLDPENQYTESRLNTVRRLLGSLSAGDKAEAPE